MDEGDAANAWVEKLVDNEVLETIRNSTSMTGFSFTTQIGTVKTTYYAVTSTLAKNFGEDYASVNEVVDALNASSTTGAVIKAFASMDEMMAAIKRDNGTDIKTISSYIDEETKNTMLKIETFADLNDAVDLSLHVGADSGAENKINMNIAQMSARGLGVNGLLVNGDTADNATKAIDTIADALQKVSNQRASLGAVQNRLEHTIANLDNIVENTTAAESQIRDTDMANEMVSYSNNQILAQAGQAMLAQSNQANQGVLSLLG